jgi:hypothetical protein
MTESEETPPTYTKPTLEQVENEIPDSLKEYPPLENVIVLDKRFEEILSEVQILKESRGKDYQHDNIRKDRLGTIPNLELVSFFAFIPNDTKTKINVFISRYLSRFKSIRQEMLDRVGKLPLPTRRKTATEKIQKEVGNPLI